MATKAGYLDPSASDINKLAGQIKAAKLASIPRKKKIKTPPPAPKVHTVKRFYTPPSATRNAVAPDGQLSMFRKGGLIPKFQKSGQIHFKDKNKSPGTDYEWVENIVTGQDLGEWVKKTPTQTVNLPEVTVTTNKIIPENTTNPVSVPTNNPAIKLTDPKSRTLKVDPTALNELPKLATALATNAKTARIMKRTTPSLLQAPTEIHKPIVTNLANENFVNNQTTNYLQSAKKAAAGTSDYNTAQAINLEARDKTIPMNIQAKAANTDMYNQTLGMSRDNAEKYAGVRNDVANQNRQLITADRARKDALEAGRLVANNASWTNYIDEMNRSKKANRMYDTEINRAKETDRLQTEYSNLLKPFDKEYEEKVNDFKKSNTWAAYEKEKAAKKVVGDSDWNTTKARTDGKTWKQAYEEMELKSIMNKRNKLSEEKMPFYKEKMQAMNTNPNYVNIKLPWKYAKGGTLTGTQKIEIENAKNRLKRDIENDKNVNKSLDRKQRQVEKILNGLSKETFFLLKTVLGK
jgi:hypothetical protein